MEPVLGFSGLGGGPWISFLSPYIWINHRDRVSAYEKVFSPPSVLLKFSRFPFFFSYFRNYFYFLHSRRYVMKRNGLICSTEQNDDRLDMDANRLSVCYNHPWHTSILDQSDEQPWNSSSNLQDLETTRRVAEHPSDMHIHGTIIKRRGARMKVSSPHARIKSTTQCCRVQAVVCALSWFLGYNLALFTWSLFHFHC